MKKLFALLFMILLGSSTITGAMETPAAAEPQHKVSDGPIFVNGNEDGFSLLQLSPETGEMTEVFSFVNSSNFYLNSNDFFFAMPLDYVPVLNGWIREQLFSPDLSKVAVSFTKDGVRSVGWIDKDGYLTDVTEAVSGEIDDFSPNPKHWHALFSPDGEFVFYDEKEGCYCFVDCDTLTITHKEEPPTFDPMGFGNYMSIEDSVFMPTGQLSDIRSKELKSKEAHVFYPLTPGGYTVISSSTDKACDVIDENTMLCTGHSDIRIAGNGISEANEYERYDAEDGVVITPETDYTMQSAAYSHGQVAFMAVRSSDRSVFVMDISGDNLRKVYTDDAYYNNLNLAFWPDSDILIHESMN